MSFYRRRYNGFGLDVDPRPAAPVPGAAPVVDPVYAVREEARLREQAVIMQAAQDKADADGRAWETYKAQALEMQRRTASESVVRQQEAARALLEDHVVLAKQREVAEVSRRADAAVYEATKAAAAADADPQREREAQVAATNANTLQLQADAAQREAAMKQASADNAEAARIQAAADSAQAAAQASANVPRQYDSEVPLVAWDQRDPAEAIPLPDGTIAMVDPLAPQVNFLLMAAAAVGGFVVRGPVGAIVGAAAGYYFTKRKA